MDFCICVTGCMWVKQYKCRDLGTIFNGLLCVTKTLKTEVCWNLTTKAPGKSNWDQESSPGSNYEKQFYAGRMGSLGRTGLACNDFDLWLMAVPLLLGRSGGKNLHAGHSTFPLGSSELVTPSGEWRARFLGGRTLGSLASCLPELWFSDLSCS